MDAVDYKHTVHIRQDAWFLRLYCWLWKASPSKVDACKLFWGYLFAPVSLFGKLLWLLIWPLRKLLGRIDWAALAEYEAPKKEKTDIPSKASEFFSRQWPRRVAKIVGVIVLGLVGAAVAGAALWGVTMLAPLVPGAIAEAFDWTITWHDGYVFALVILMAVTGFVFLIWAEDHFQWEQRRLEKKKRKNERGELTFGQALGAGVKAVKTNTCPRIQVVDRKRSSA